MTQTQTAALALILSHALMGAACIAGFGAASGKARTLGGRLTYGGLSLASMAGTATMVWAALMIAGA